LAAQRTCPKNAIEFVEALEQLGARMEPTVVNFVGFNNPDPGAFFIFEIVSSKEVSPSTFKIEARRSAVRALNNYQRRSACFQPGGLTIELIAWDPDKQFLTIFTSWSTAAGSIAATPRIFWTMCSVASPAERV
jgi:hypothetical protein